MAVVQRGAEVLTGPAASEPFLSAAAPACAPGSDIHNHREVPSVLRDEIQVNFSNTINIS